MLADFIPCGEDATSEGGGGGVMARSQGQDQPHWPAFMININRDHKVYHGTALRIFHLSSLGKPRDTLVKTRSGSNRYSGKSMEIKGFMRRVIKSFV